MIHLFDHCQEFILSLEVILSCKLASVSNVLVVMHASRKSYFFPMSYRRGETLNELLLLEWNVKSQTTTVVSQYVEDGPLAHNIVEVPNSKGLAFLFRLVMVS